MQKSCNMLNIKLYPTVTAVDFVDVENRLKVENIAEFRPLHVTFEMTHDMTLQIQRHSIRKKKIKLTDFLPR